MQTFPEGLLLFQSFFPRPKWYFLSALIWTLIAIAGWYGVVRELGVSMGFKPFPEGDQPIGLAHFFTPDFLWFYLYYAVFSVIFGVFWWIVGDNRKWQLWSVWGSQLIIFITYFSVQISVAINNWRRPFGDTLQAALQGDGGITTGDFYTLMLIFLQIAFLSVTLFIVTRFFVSHYIFRWRTAMNDYYTGMWERVRHIEGASQRVQEDTMRFASIMEGLGVSMIDSVMTLIAFLPVLFSLSQYVTELPIVGAIPAPLFTAAIFWSLFGTVLMVVVGVKLPGLEFRNQRVEAAYRKELVYGEDHADRAQPETLVELFDNVRRNYFRLYLHYTYFNLARSLYLQADNIFAYFILVPAIVAGAVTYGLVQQIVTAFGQVASSFQYLVMSWSTIIELISIYKRLAAFEAAIFGQPLPEIDREDYQEPGGDVVEPHPEG